MCLGQCIFLYLRSLFNSVWIQLVLNKGIAFQILTAFFLMRQWKPISLKHKWRSLESRIKSLSNTLSTRLWEAAKNYKGVSAKQTYLHMYLYSYKYDNDYSIWMDMDNFQNFRIFCRGFGMNEKLHMSSFQERMLKMFN